MSDVATFGIWDNTKGVLTGYTLDIPAGILRGMSDVPGYVNRV